VDAVGDGDTGLDDADGVRVGWAARRLAGTDDRFAVADEGTLVTVARKGRPAHDPADADPADADPADAEAQVAGVCTAVTRPAAGDRAGPELWAR